MAAFEITPDMNERDVAAIEIVNPMLERLSARRAKQVVVEGHLAKSKIAWNVARYQQALLYRVVMLADGCASNWNLGNPLCSLLAARALTETVALLLVFKDRLQRLLEEEDLGGIHALTLNASFATRDAEWLKQHPESEAVSVLTHLDKLDETEDLAGIRAEYEELSERCHPNSPGTLFFFGTLDRTSGATSYSEAKRDADSLNRVLSAACMVGFAEKAFSHLDDAITKIAELQDRVTGSMRGMSVLTPKADVQGAQRVRSVPTADISRSGKPEGAPLAVVLSRICRSAKVVRFIDSSLP